MRNRITLMRLTALILSASLPLLISASHSVAVDYEHYQFKAGDQSLQQWQLPVNSNTSIQLDNGLNQKIIELGKMLFFDTRLSGDGSQSCASCHNPENAWADGLPKAKGFQQQVLTRATPTLINTAFNTIYMWDGRNRTLEEQAMGPIFSKQEMNMEKSQLLSYLRNEPRYEQAFQQSFPTSSINEQTISTAIAAFERTIVSLDSPFDRWLTGDSTALTAQQINGFKLFLNPDKGACEFCHAAPNFTDNGFHNIGLASWGHKNPDMGRYKEKPIRLMKGAFKTPSLRNIAATAPYFHDGSAISLEQVIEHYTDGGVIKNNLSPNMKAANLSDSEKKDLIAFLHSLTGTVVSH